MRIKLSMLLTQSIFHGIFIGAFNIVAWTLLVSTFDENILAPGIPCFRSNRHIVHIALQQAENTLQIKRFHTRHSDLLHNPDNIS